MNKLIKNLIPFPINEVEWISHFNKKSESNEDFDTLTAPKTSAAKATLVYETYLNFSFAVYFIPKFFRTCLS